ncbi:MAG: type IV secretion system DNA-binding domain-containing protein [Oscillospiraceae bacterium]|jgi:type IV secretory pathway TraG/TraD family ATPase VirD4|nr:type IV secretion system DNA-binding domain-containing protein [Oscillospiraceae bacterium]
MSGIDIFGVVVILATGGVFMGLIRMIFGKRDKSDVFDFVRDYEQARNKPRFAGYKPAEESVFIGTANRKNVFIPSDAKHVFICGTTGSGKTVALANFLQAGAQFDYPMLIIDGKGDTNAGSLLEMTRQLCPDRKIYVINLNDPTASDKYNPFKNTSTDVIKDMLINMTSWSEPHYKYNTERYIGRLCRLLAMQDIAISLDSLTQYLPKASFVKLSKDISEKKLISKEEHLEDVALAKVSGEIAEGAAARFATIRDSDLGKIFDESGIDIYTALQENAVILFILNPLLYPETSPLIGNLIIIDSKKAVSHFYHEKKKRIFYIMDEINTYASGALLDLVNKSRSANVTCILATQSLSDLGQVSEQFTEQVIENCNNYIVLRQNSSVNAEHWANVVGTRETLQATYQITGESGEAQSTNLGSLRKTREYLYHPDDIKLLGTGQAIFVSRDKMLHTRVNINKPF